MMTATTKSKALFQRKAVFLRALYIAAYVAFGYLVLVEVFALNDYVRLNWSYQLYTLLAVLCVIAALLASYGLDRGGGTAAAYGIAAAGVPRERLAATLLAAMNVVPVVAAAVRALATARDTPPWSVWASDNCPPAIGRNYTAGLPRVWPDPSGGPACDTLDMLLDDVGLISARVARLDLGLSLLFAARGPSQFRGTP